MGMGVSTLVTWVTMAALVAVLVLDLLIVGRRPHEPSMKEATAWVVFYVLLASVFGVFIWSYYGSQYGQEFFAGWVTEYSLSIDNLFIFVIIMNRFAVPRIYQQRVLMIGIVLALAMRAVLILAGAALVERFVWVFYLFGVLLLYTAYRLVRSGEMDDAEFKDNIVIRWARRILPISAEYDGPRVTTRNGIGHRIFTPMLIVMLAIGTTDLVFALDSIPAIFGLTKEWYLVLTANVFALMGLRQLYFLLGGLLRRLVYLSYGLAVVLGFIGVKLVLEAAAGNNVPFINGGEPIHGVPHITIAWSLGTIIFILAVTTVASLIKSSRDQKRQQFDTGPPSGGPTVNSTVDKAPGNHASKAGAAKPLDARRPE